MPFGIPDNYRLILASRSPRRQELLRETGLSFNIVSREYEESYPEGLSGREIAEYLAGQKALHFRDGQIGEREIIITADTIVWCCGRVLDKPADPDEAFRILKLISGRTHEVVTGVCLVSDHASHIFSEVTKVTFDTISDEEMAFYITNYKPYDKAGGYGIQEWIGIVANSHIDGSYFNVMGLPVNRLIRELKIFIQKQENI
jgi:septum formation protein